MADESSTMDALTQYDYYCSGLIESGLTADGDDYFKLNGKPFRIASGSLHYFRIPSQYWKDRLRKARACGLNCIDTYVPWNAHQREQGIELDFNGILDIRRFLQTAVEEDLFVILRPGPYICAEWDFGGLPAWLLRDPEMRVRSTYPPFKAAVKDYFRKLFDAVGEMQFSRKGPVIAIQVENEFGSYGDTQTNREDLNYMMFIKETLLEFGATEMFFTSDYIKYDDRKGTLPGVLLAANFQENAEEELTSLKSLQPSSPLYVAEYWSGWFDHWSENHHVTSVEKYAEELRTILCRKICRRAKNHPRHKASVNIYMFHGGTNFGFYNGANQGFPLPESPYAPTITSYDYDAPLSECGDYTDKYFQTKAILQELQDPVLKKFKIPEMPPLKPKMTLKNIVPTASVTLGDLLHWTDWKNSISVEDPMYLEYLQNVVQLSERPNINLDAVFILYRILIEETVSHLFLPEINDRAIVFLDGQAIAIVDCRTPETRNIDLQKIWPKMGNKHQNVGSKHTLDILVENMGRVNYGNPQVLNSQRKGMNGIVNTNTSPLKNWTIHVLDFNEHFFNIIKTSSLGNRPMPSSNHRPDFQNGPILSYFPMTLSEHPLDSFLSSDSWTKGVAWVNGTNLGRYWKIGPQRTLYLPAPILHRGHNEIFIFDLHGPIRCLNLLDSPVLG